MFDMVLEDAYIAQFSSVIVLSGQFILDLFKDRNNLNFISDGVKHNNEL